MDEKDLEPMSPEALMRALILAPEEQFRIVVMTRPPGWTDEQKVLITDAIYQALGQMFGPGAEASVGFMVQMMVEEEGPSEGVLPIEEGPSDEVCVCGHLKSAHEAGYPGWCTGCDPDDDQMNASHGFAPRY